MRAKKSLGQNFLRSKNALQKIVTAGELTRKDTVLEIGPGKGALTRALLDTGAHVIAIEKDRELIPFLNDLFQKEIKSGALTLREGDVMSYDPSTDIPKGKTYKLIANIPYYITGAIIKKFLTEKKQPERMVVLVQDEVGRRIAKDKKESILSLSVKAYGTPRYIARVPRGAFTPSPKVDSAILAINDISRTHFQNTLMEKRFFDILHAGFAHKRKMALGNLATIASKQKVEKIFEELHLSPKTRPEDIAFPTWLSLGKTL